MWGKRSLASLGEISSASKPKPRAWVMARLISLNRGSEAAMRSEPTFFQPMSWPVSSARRS
jgi:hypothetical protein